MRWFKHLSNASEDEYLTYLIHEMGPEGYGIYFIILENIAKQMDDKSQYFITYPEKKWISLLNVSAQKLRKFIELIRKLPQNFGRSEDLLLFSYNNNLLTISAPKLIKFRDEYSKKKKDKDCDLSGQTPDNVRRKETETETETDTDTQTEEKTACVSKGENSISFSSKQDQCELEKFEFPEESQLAWEKCAHCVRWGDFQSSIKRLESQCVHSPEIAKPVLRECLLWFADLTRHERGPSLATLRKHFQEELHKAAENPPKPPPKSDSQSKFDACKKRFTEELQERIEKIPTRKSQDVDPVLWLKNAEKQFPLQCKPEQIERTKKYAGEKLWDEYAAVVKQFCEIDLNPP